jgi:hypothetical protein
VDATSLSTLAQSFTSRHARVKFSVDVKHL